ncbi:MAG: hypothetical protein WCR20_19120 [Verrucomicrobiota bacterium]
MSFFKLLAAGKSMMGLSGTSSRYQATNERLLPKFIGRKNPFRGTTHPGGKAPETGEPGGVVKPKESSTVVKGGGPFAASPAVEARKQVTRGISLSERVGKVRGRAGQVWKDAKAWVASKKKKAGPAPQPVVMPVQRELTLESVRVVRSDLTDCDDEMDALRGTVRGVVQRPVQTMQRGTEAVMAVERTARDLFGSQRVER